MALKIRDVRAYVIEGPGVGGDYHNQERGHWLIDTLIANPMSRYPEYKKSRTSWGINVFGSILVEIETDDGIVGVGTSLGGDPACFMIEKHFRRFLIGSDPRDLARIWDQMFRASMPYGRKGITLAAISAVDLALWDVLGLYRGEPVYKLIGGATRGKLPVYATGIRPERYKELGFFGAKLPLPHGPTDGKTGLRENVKFFMEAREKVGPDFPLMVDCYMSLEVPYAIDLARALESVGVSWIEEPLHPDDIDGYRRLKEALPHVHWTCGEHEYSRYGFRELISERLIDIVQPDLTWVGGLTEGLRISALAAAYDIPVVPHGSGVYSYHFVMSQPHSPFVEYVVTSPASDTILPVFGGLFVEEPLPKDGFVVLDDAPGWGVRLNRQAVSLRRPYSA